MKKEKVKLINMFFGNTSKTRFIRVIILIVLIVLSVLSIFNLRCADGRIEMIPTIKAEYKGGSK